jgi:hypothetical protein
VIGQERAGRPSTTSGFLNRRLGVPPPPESWLRTRLSESFSSIWNEPVRDVPWTQALGVGVSVNYSGQVLLPAPLDVLAQGNGQPIGWIRSTISRRLARRVDVDVLRTVGLTIRPDVNIEPALLVIVVATSPLLNPTKGRCATFGSGGSTSNQHRSSTRKSHTASSFNV